MVIQMLWKQEFTKGPFGSTLSSWLYILRLLSIWNYLKKLGEEKKNLLVDWVNWPFNI